MDPAPVISVLGVTCPKIKATPAMLQEIDFQRPKYGQHVQVPSAPIAQPSETPPTHRLTDEDIKILSDIAPNAAVITCVDAKPKIPLPLTPYEALQDLGEIDGIHVLKVLKCTLNSNSIKRLASLTVKQSMSKPWQKHRKGRITGSKMHSVFTLKESTSCTNIVKSILGMLPDFKTPSMKYGIDNEETARRTYSKFQNEFHQNFKCETTGLILNEKYPHLGSSPDGMVECGCCRKGCLEIKCLAKYKDGLPGPILADDPQCSSEIDSDIWFLSHDKNYPVDDNFQLKKFHQYFTQVQGHMLITEVDYCDLYLWSKTRSITVRVDRDSDFIEKLCTKLTSEYLTHVVPKLMENSSL